jgi:hypothetical protein
MPRLIRALFTLLALLVGGRALAHEATMGVIEFREVQPGLYIGRWTSEPNIGAAKVQLRVPPHCRLALPELQCGAKGLVGQVSVDNIGANLSAVLLKVTALDGKYRSYTISTANPTVNVLGAGAPTIDTWIELARTYVNYGIEHILLGADHLLFVLGLIWIVKGGWKLAKTITAFTVGHSLSLGAAAFGLFGVPERPLNACIALSIVFIGVEIIKMQRGETTLTARRPWLVAFSFGLVHGIGFAGALAGLGIERSVLPAALLFFNVGVEIGQLAFVLVVLALIWAHRRLEAQLPSWGEAVPAYAIGSVAMFWFIGRMVKIVTTSTLS